MLYPIELPAAVPSRNENDVSTKFVHVMVQAARRPSSHLQLRSDAYKLSPVEHLSQNLKKQP